MSPKGFPQMPKEKEFKSKDKPMKDEWAWSEIEFGNFLSKMRIKKQQNK